MKNYKTPGVYIEEIPSLPASIVPVETAIPAFIGYTEKARLKEDDDLRLVPQRITSLFEYERFFGGPRNETGIQVTINTTVIPAEVEAKITAPSSYMMFNQVQAFYNNGGGPCYIVSVGGYQDGDVINPADLQIGLAEVAKIDEVTLITFPDGPNTGDPGDYYDVAKSALDQCEKLQDRFVVMDVVINQADATVDNVQIFRDFDFGVKDTRKYGAAYYPYIETRYDYRFNDADVTVNINGGIVQLDALESQNNAQYNQARVKVNAIPMILPPSGSVLGIYASVDETRGVWKAPANVNIDSAIRPTIKITDEDQEILNVDPTAGKSINAIRSFTGRGPAIVWGARTLAGNDNEWRYVSVRRFFNMAEESIKKATVQFVFEPNDINTWTQVRSMIENFLTQQWRAGALLGTTPEEAYFVKVGLNETMTEFDILEGRMIVEIGMAVVRPAEFIILRFSHKMLQQS
jgi:uncharacterized protein